MTWNIFSIILLSSVVFLDLALSAPVYFNKRLEEAEQISLEATGLLLPIDPVVNRIMRDLKSIRHEYPLIQNVVHKKKWIPGEVIIQSVSDDQINQIDESRLFGTLQEVRKVRSGYGSLLAFSSPFNPEKLAQKLYENFGVKAQPNFNTEDANGSIRYNPTDGIFTIEQKPKFASYAGFRNKSTWEFIVTNGKVKLLRSLGPGFEFSGSS